MLCCQLGSNHHLWCGIFLVTAIAPRCKISVFLSTVPVGFYDFYSYLILLFLKSEFAALHLAEAQEHLTFLVFFVSLQFFSLSLSFFLILLFSETLISILGNLQSDKTPVSSQSCFSLLLGAMEQPKNPSAVWAALTTSPLCSMVFYMHMIFQLPKGMGTICSMSFLHKSPSRRTASLHPFHKKGCKEEKTTHVSHGRCRTVPTTSSGAA